MEVLKYLFDINGLNYRSQQLEIEERRREWMTIDDISYIQFLFLRQFFLFGFSDLT